MHDDWVWHRSSDRFVRNMLTIGSSGINQALSKELTFVTLDAVSDRHPNWEHLVEAADLVGLQILWLNCRFSSCSSTRSSPATKTSAASSTQASEP